MNVPTLTSVNALTILPIATSACVKRAHKDGPRVPVTATLKWEDGEVSASLGLTKSMSQNKPEKEGW